MHSSGIEALTEDQHSPQGRKGPAGAQGQGGKRRFGELSFVHNPDEKDSWKAEGREQRGEER